MTTPRLVEHFFRHEYGRLVATLSRRVGVQHLEAIEDAVHSALNALLERFAPSAIHKLNRAVAVAECHGPAAGLEVLDGFEPPAWLAGSYLWAAVLADLHQRCGNAQTAQRYRDRAFESAPTAAVKHLLQRRLQTR